MKALLRSLLPISAALVMLEAPATAWAAEFRFNDDGCHSSSVELAGDMQPGDGARFDQFVAQVTPRSTDSRRAPCKLWTVFLDSKGGSTTEAMLIGRRIRQLEAATYVRGDAVCASACVLVLAGGVQREVAGTVGIHRPYFASLSPTLSSAAVRSLRDQGTKAISHYLAEMDISPMLLDAMLSVPPEEMRLLTDAELDSFRLQGADATYDERGTALAADKMGITSAEYRRREAFANSKCGHLSEVSQILRCRDPIMWGLPAAVLQVRKAKAQATCRELPDHAKIQACWRSVMLSR